EIAAYEKDAGFSFPQIFKLYLKTMNGTDKERINIYGRSGEPYRPGIGYYSYPRDREKIFEMIDWIYESCHVSKSDIEAREIPHIIPIIAHRFIVIDRCSSNPVLSMYGDDIIAYSSNLIIFLVDDIFYEARQDQHLSEDLHVKFWLD
nr:hypothetical protein [Candidatus Sigynarchaeota archaeon]